MVSPDERDAPAPIRATYERLAQCLTFALGPTEPLVSVQKREKDSLEQKTRSLYFSGEPLCIHRAESDR